MPQCTGSPTSDELNIGVIFQGVTKMAGKTKGPAAAKAVKKKSAKKVVKKRSEEHTSELQSLMRISYAVFCLKKKILNRQKEHIARDTRQTSTTRATRR